MKRYRLQVGLVGMYGLASVVGCQSADMPHPLRLSDRHDRQRITERDLLADQQGWTGGGPDRLLATASDPPEDAETSSVVLVSGLDSASLHLSLDELLELATSGNPTLRQSEALVHQARANWWQVGLSPNPNFTWTSEGNNASFDGHYGTLSQEIVTSGKLTLNRQVAAADVQSAGWENQAQVLRVLNDVKIRYISVLGAQRRVRVAEELLSVADEGVRATERFYQAEQVSQSDVLQATLQQRQTQILVRNSRLEVESAWRQLSHVVGHPSLPLHELAGDLEEGFDELDWDVVWEDLLQSSPQLLAARSRVSAASAQVRRERAEVKPNWQVAAGAGVDVLPAGAGFPLYNVSLGSEVPIWNRNQGNISAAVWLCQLAEAEVLRLELALRDGLAGAFERYQIALSEVESYRDPILITAERNLQLTQRAYAEGELDYLRVLIAQQELAQARIQYVTSLTAVNQAAIEIEGLLLTGGLDVVESMAVPANTSGQTADEGR